jgi:hypothetical protein
MDPLEQARSYILTAKHGFIMELAKMGRLATEIREICELIDWNLEMESQAERIKETLKLQQGQAQSRAGSGTGLPIG